MYDKLGGRSERFFGPRSPRAAWLVRKRTLMARRGFIGCRSGLRAAGGAFTQLRNHNTRLQRSADGVDIGERRCPTGNPSMDHAVSSGRNQYRGEPRSGCCHRWQDDHLFLRNFRRDLCRLGGEPNNHPGRRPCDRRFPNLPGQQKQQYRYRKQSWKRFRR